MKQRHWQSSDFVVTATNAAYDGSDTVNRFGYCRKCGCDMQSFGGDGKLGPIKHYHSHHNSRRMARITTSANI